MEQLKTIRIVVIFLSINVFVFTSCSNNDDDNNDDPITEEITCTNAIAMYIPTGIEPQPISNNIHRAQVFTTLSSASNFNIILELKSILEASVEDNLEPIQLDIVTVTDGAPNWGNVIGSANVPIDKIDHSPNTIDGFSENVFLYNSVALTIGTQYALVLKTQVSNFNLFWKSSKVSLDENNPYSSGNAWEYTTIEKREFQHESFDHQFRICEITE